MARRNAGFIRQAGEWHWGCRMNPAFRWWCQDAPLVEKLCSDPATVRRWRVQGGGHNVPECSKIICGLPPEATLRLPRGYLRTAKKGC
jgi:hypothetical protein